jgi:hypothetical protein
MKVLEGALPLDMERIAAGQLSVIAASHAIAMLVMHESLAFH